MRTELRPPGLILIEAADAGEVRYAPRLARRKQIVTQSERRRDELERRTFTRGGAVLVAAAPTNPKMVYVLTERLEVWRSADAGINWERAG